MRDYPFSIPAGVGAFVRINASGQMFAYVTGNAGGADDTLYVQVAGSASGEMELRPGESIKFADGKIGSEFTVFSKSGVAVQGVIKIADAGYNANRVTGEVSVIDGGKFRTLAGGAFVGVVTLGAVAATFPCVQLWNPAGSAKNLIVKSMLASSPTAQVIGLYGATIQLPTLVGVGTSKLVGGAAPASQLRSENAASIVGSVLYQFNVAASTPFPVGLDEPVVIRPGFGLVVAGGTANTAITGNFEWVEE